MGKEDNLLYFLSPSSFSIDICSPSSMMEHKLQPCSKLVWCSGYRQFVNQDGNPELESHLCHEINK